MKSLSFVRISVPRPRTVSDPSPRNTPSYVVVPAGTVTVRDNVSHSVAAGLEKGSGVTVRDSHNLWAGA